MLSMLLVIFILAITLFQIGSFSVGIGNILGALCSWSRNKSIILLIIHGFFGWFYVSYYFLTGGGNTPDTPV